MKMTNYRAGRFAEFLARLFLRFKGYNIIYKNYKNKKGTFAGEIDFIACKHHTLIFVEVKKRSSIEAAAEAIKLQQQRRILKGAEVFLQKHPVYVSYDIRFDAILVCFPLSIRHIQNAWQSN